MAFHPSGKVDTNSMDLEDSPVCIPTKWFVCTHSADSGDSRQLSRFGSFQRGSDRLSRVTTIAISSRYWVRVVCEVTPQFQGIKNYHIWALYRYQWTRLPLRGTSSSLQSHGVYLRYSRYPKKWTSELKARWGDELSPICDCLRIFCRDCRSYLRTNRT